MKRNALCLGLIACLVLLVSPAQGIIISTNAANHVHHDDCDCGLTSGGTDLLRVSNYLLNDLTGGAIKAELQFQFPADDLGNSWNYSFGSETLKGTLTIDWYKAFDVPSCYHGAQITCHYVRHKDDPENLDWIQLYTETGGSGSSVNRVDGEEDNNPAYFTEWDDREDYIHVPNPGGLIFGDSPYDWHDESQAWSGSVTFSLFLASYDDHDITLYDAITWGYVGYCVPEPQSIVVWSLLTAFAIVIGRWQRRRESYLTK